MEEVAFPEYCKLSGTFAETAIISSGQRKSMDGCEGCPRHECFGNDEYDQLLDRDQQSLVKYWKDYISKQIAALG